MMHRFGGTSTSHHFDEMSTEKMQGEDAIEPEAGVARILFRLRTQGPIWILRRLRTEQISPSTKPGQLIHAFCRHAMGAAMAPIRAIRRSLASHIVEVDSTLFAFYDLKVQPITYDFLWFLTGAETMRRQLGLARVHVVIVPGPAEGLRQEDPRYEQVVDHHERERRVHRILMGAFPMLRSCTAFSLAGSRDEVAALRSLAAHVYPASYETSLPTTHHPNDTIDGDANRTGSAASLRARPQELAYIDKWYASCASGQRLVTITLREYGYNPARNSNMQAWIEFARRLDPAKYFPVFVLDTEQTLYRKPAALDDLVIFREVSWDVGLRMALYERAWLNLGVNNGPMGLCWLNSRTRYISFKMCTPSVPQTSERYMKSLGFEPNASLPFASPLQKWIWGDDSLDAIQREFDEMAAKIEAAEKAGEPAQA
jgi:hypothetical protein